jgi:putative DNA primase/helicase
MSAPPAPAPGKPAYDMAAFLARHPELNAQPPVPYGTRGGLQWVLEECPFDSQHQGGSAVLFVRGSGRPEFKCKGAGCAGRHWRDLVRLLEPPVAQASGFRLEDDGVYYDAGEPGEPPVHISGPLEILACTRDRRSENWGRLIRSRDADGCVHEWAMPMELLAGDGAAYREVLHSQGLYVATGRRARALLAAYIQNSLPAERIRCTDHIGWDGGIYVLPDTAIGPAGSENLVYQTDHNIEHFYRVSGTLSGWQSGIAARCLRNSRLIFAVSAAFAGPLLAWLEVEGGGVHLVGSTSEGKTTLLVAAGSVIGGGGQRGFARTWRSTANGLEAIAELHNDNLLLLDELRELSDPREADSVAYMLANGAGKARMTRTITARRSLQWRLLFLSSGEIRLSEYAASVGRRTKGGAEVRLLNIPGDAGAGMGAFENLHGADSAATFADELMTAAKKHYGHALRAFLAALVANRSQLVDQARQTMDDFVRTFLPQGASPEVGRALRRFALVAAAGELASSLGITGWPQGEAWWGAGQCFQAWLADRGGAGAFDAEAAVCQVRAFLALNGASRFQPVTHRFDRNQNEIVERVINRAGFWRGTKSTREYLIFPEIFKREVCAGFDYRAVAAELERRGWLKRSRPHWTKKARGAPEGSRFFCVRGTILNE